MIRRLIGVVSGTFGGARGGVWGGGGVAVGAVASACLGALLVTAGGCRPVPGANDPYTTVARGDVGLPVLSFRWKFHLANRLRESKPQEFASAALYGEQVLVGSAEGSFYALSAADGRELWSTTLGGISTTPVVDERGRLYIGTTDGAMICLQAGDGAEIWRYATRGSILEKPVLVDGQIIFSNEADQVYALDSDTGKFRWQYKSETPEEFTLRGHAGVAVADDLVFSGFSNGTMVALRQNTGSVAWLTSLKGEADRFVDVDGTPVVAGDMVLVTSSSGGVYALDKSTGLVRWRLPMVGASGLFVEDNRAYVTAAEEGVHAIDLQGHIVWRQGTRDGGEPAPPIATGSYVLYSLSEDGLFIADRRTGEVHQYFDPGDGVSATPTIDGDRLYVVSNGGVLYAMYINRY